MPYKDLREYIQRLEKEGLFRWVDEEVDKDWELSCVMRAIFRGLAAEKRVAVGFRNVKGYNIPVVVGIIGASKQVQAMALETEPDAVKIHEKWVKAQENPIDPVMVSSGPVKDVIIKGKEVDLYKIPVPVWTPGRDPAPFFNPLWVTKNPATMGRNMGMYRVHIKGKAKTGIYFAGSHQHAQNDIAAWDALNKPTEAAFIAGCDPSIYIAAVTKVPPGVDEFSMAGGIRGEPVELVKCETVDIEVPASAEYIIEGEFRPNEREPEGPFGEWTGYMASAPFGMPVFHVKCITHRKDPIYQGVISQMPPSESSGVRQALYEGLVVKHLKHDLKLPGIVDVHLPESTGCNGYLWISLKKSYPGQVEQVAAAALGRMGPRISKYIVIVDDDIDIRDAFAREWALGFRVRPEEDIQISRVTAALSMDPSATDDENIPLDDRTGAKVVIDATKKWEFPAIALPPRKYLEKVTSQWSKYGLPEVDSSWVFRGVPEK